MKSRVSRVKLLVPLVSLGLLLPFLSASPALGSGASSVRALLPAPLACNQSAGHCWKPAVKARWQYQLQGSPGRHGGCRYASTGFVNIGVTGTSFASGRTVAPTVFDIDFLKDGKCYSPQDYSVLNYAAVQALHVRGAKVIGYVDAGTAETWRPDYPEMQAFDQSCDGCLFGNPLSNFPDEYWLNINPGVKGINPNTGRSETTRQFLLDEMLARVKEAKLIGVDAIEFDDVDGYQSHSGLSITAAAQLSYNAALANLAHRLGLSVGLKNDRDQADGTAALLRLRDRGGVLADSTSAAPSRPGRPSTARRCSTWSTSRTRPRSAPQSNSPQFDFNSIRKTDDLFDLPYTPCR